MSYLFCYDWISHTKEWQQYQLKYCIIKTIKLHLAFIPLHFLLESRWGSPYFWLSTDFEIFIHTFSWFLFCFLLWFLFLLHPYNYQKIYVIVSRHYFYISDDFFYCRKSYIRGMYIFKMLIPHKPANKLFFNDRL